MLFCNIMRTA